MIQVDTEWPDYCQQGPLDHPRPIPQFCPKFSPLILHLVLTFCSFLFINPYLSHFVYPAIDQASLSLEKYFTESELSPCLNFSELAISPSPLYYPPPWLHISKAQIKRHCTPDPNYYYFSIYPSIEFKFLGMTLRSLHYLSRIIYSHSSPNILPLNQAALPNRPWLLTSPAFDLTSFYLYCLFPFPYGTGWVL